MVVVAYSSDRSGEPTQPLPCLWTEACVKSWARVLALEVRGLYSCKEIAQYLERPVARLAVDGGLTAATCRRWW